MKELADQGRIERQEQCMSLSTLILMHASDTQHAIT
jgi:hypothetical protein